MGKKTEGDALKASLVRMAQGARRASRLLGGVSAQQKNAALVRMAEALRAGCAQILRANQRDLADARKRGVKGAFLERLTLNEKRVGEMADSLKEIAGLDDPVGEVISSWTRPNGLVISRVRVPIGVILIIYESRPNVTSDCVGLCLKSGNSVVLRGGSDARGSNAAIFRVLEKAVREEGLPAGAVNLVEVADRRAVDVLLGLDPFIDLVMPRGGESLIRRVRHKSKIPVIKHFKGVCHVFVDASADFAVAQRIALNAKLQRPSVCNAMETLLVHEGIAKDFLPTMIEALQDAGVEVRGCAKTRQRAQGVKKATEDDWSTEYLDLILSVKVVAGVREAIEHINRYGSGHSDAIVTSDPANAELFLRDVDSACVYVNASTRFTDGGQFGLGAEVGISTDKLHARGPMGIRELTTYKYVVRGNGQVRE